MAALLETVEVETGPGPGACVIWLHGLGADGHDFEPIVPELDLPRGLGVRFVFPHAPMQAVTINGGAVMRAWYDVYGLEGERREDAAGVRASQARVATTFGGCRLRGGVARLPDGARGLRAGDRRHLGLARARIALSAPLAGC